MSEENTTITKADIENVSAKLQAAMASMSEQEQNVLGLILSRAAVAETPDVEGFAFSPVHGGVFSTPFSAQLARATGLGPVAGTATVSWGYHFGKVMGNFGEQFQ